jgi:GTP-sensing pleiotropic transcriptional regulator CodY
MLLNNHQKMQTILQKHQEELQNSLMMSWLANKLSS